MLIGYVQVNAKNFEDKTALEIFQANPSGDQDLAKMLNRAGRAARPYTPNLSRSQFLSMELTSFEKFISQFSLQDESARNMTIAVATLVATTTYQAMLTPPGGYWQDNSSKTPVNSTVVAANFSGIAVERPYKAGAILNGLVLYAFTLFNSSVFLASVIIIWFTAIPLLPRTFTVYLLMGFVGGAYFLTLMVEFWKSDEFAGCLIPFIYIHLLVVVLIFPGISVVNSFRLRRRIDAPRTRVATSKE